MKHGKKLTGLVMAGIMTAGVLTGCTNEPSANTASDTKTEDQSAKSETASQEQGASDPWELSILIQHICLGSHANEGSKGIKQVYEQECKHDYKEIQG